MKRKKIKTGVRQVALDSLEHLESIQKTALGFGISVEAIQTPGTKKYRGTIHWMFDDNETGERLLNYYPGKGTCYIGGFKGRADSPAEALEIAKKMLAEKSQ